MDQLRARMIAGIDTTIASGSFSPNHVEYLKQVREIWKQAQSYKEVRDKVEPLYWTYRKQDLGILSQIQNEMSREHYYKLGYACSSCAFPTDYDTTIDHNGAKSYGSPVWFDEPGISCIESDSSQLFGFHDNEDICDMIARNTIMGLRIKNQGYQIYGYLKTDYYKGDDVKCACYKVKYV